MKKKTYYVRNIIEVNDPNKLTYDSFEEKYLYTSKFKEISSSSKMRVDLINVIINNLIVADSNDYNDTNDNAGKDYSNPERCQLIFQYFIDEACKLLNIKNIPKIKVDLIYYEKDRSRGQILVNDEFNEITKKLKEKMRIEDALPLVAAARCNRLIKTSSLLNSDLLLSNPMSNLVGDKLFEISFKNLKLQNIIENLIHEVEFPDIRKHVNNNSLNFENIMDIRKNAIKFRKWIQCESERDRNAIIAYHKEVAKESKITKYGRSFLHLFGVLGSQYLGVKLNNIYSPEIGAVTGGSISYLFDIAYKLGKNWKPIIFGDWLKDKIEKIISKKSSPHSPKVR